MKRLSAVVTSTGIATAIGLTNDETRTAMISGKSGIKLLENYEYRRAGLPVGYCDIERIKNWLVEQGISFAENEARSLLLAMYAVGMALKEAKPLKTGEKRGLYLGSSLTAHDTLVRSYELIFAGKRNPAGVIVECSNCYFTARIAREFGFQEGCTTISSSCASGIQCIGFAMRDLELGIIDEAVVVGVDSALAKGLLDTWMSARVLSRIEPPETAARPFCNTRRGFVLAEGAGCIILRKADDHALLEIIGVHSNNGSENLFAVTEDHMVRCMQGALDNAGIGASEIDFIHANANGSRQGDLEEAKALNRVFGKETPIYSSKSLYGNTQGAQGINNLIHSMLIMQQQNFPQNAHIFEPDPEIDSLINCGYGKDSVTHLNTGLLNTFGFSGMNAVAVFRHI